MWKIFITTIQFLTRIPIKKYYIIEENILSRGIVFFPIIGLIIGVFNLGIYFLTFYLTSSITISILFILFANLIITGGIHLDGIADAADGLFSGRDKNRMLEIMKDSHIGSFGVIAIIFDFAFRFVFLKSLCYTPYFAMCILLMPVFAKTIVAIYIALSSDARNGNGMGSFFMNGIKKKYMYISLLSGLIIISIGLAIKGLVAFVLCLLMAYIIADYVSNKIGGATGDIFGAMNECMEITFLFAMIILEVLL